MTLVFYSKIIQIVEKWAPNSKILGNYSLCSVIILIRTDITVNACPSRITNASILIDTIFTPTIHAWGTGAFVYIYNENKFRAIDMSLISENYIVNTWNLQRMCNFRSLPISSWVINLKNSYFILLAFLVSKNSKNDFTLPYISNRYFLYLFWGYMFIKKLTYITVNPRPSIMTDASILVDTILTLTIHAWGTGAFVYIWKEW